MTKNGFSLIEVLVFVTILSVFFVSAMAVTTYSLRTMKTNQQKIIASHLAEEGIEWLRGEKEDNWTTFKTHDSQAGTTTYCANTLDFNSLGSCNSFSLGTPAIFKREMGLTNISEDQVNASVTVSWQDNHEIEINTVFKVLE